MNYGEVVLGVECALPRKFALVRRPGRARRLMTWLFATLVRRT